MSEVRLHAIGNATDSLGLYGSTNGGSDNGPLAPNAITHTGGHSGDYIQVPDCSESRFFPDHHISIGAADESWEVSLWADDENGGQVCWSPTAHYSEGYTFPQSNGVPNCTILIRLDASNNPECYWAPY